MSRGMRLERTVMPSGSHPQLEWLIPTIELSLDLVRADGPGDTAYSQERSNMAQMTTDPPA